MRCAFRTMLVVAGAAGMAAIGGVAYAESFPEDFENSSVYPIGWHIRDTDPWWGQSGSSDDPIIQAGVGVGGSVGLSAAARNFHWAAHPFEWKDPTIAGVVLQMDFRTPSSTTDQYFAFRDKIGWTTQEFGTDSGYWLQIELYKNQIRGSWNNASGSGRTPVIVTYDTSTMTASTFYRAAFKLTKLTDTSAQIDVSLHAINTDGSTGDEITSETIADTATLGSDTPDPALFMASTMWPTYRNYNNGASGPCDNAYFEIIRIDAPDCFSKVTPEEADIQYVATDINATPTPASIDYTVQNLGLNAFTYTVTELDDQQQPADVSWLSTNKSQATVSAQTSDTLTANFNSTGLAGGSYTAYLKFTDDCNPAVEHIRQINLSVYGCRWTLDSCNQERSYALDYPSQLPEDVVYRVTNTGAYPVNYAVAKSGDSSCFGWLTVTNPTGTVDVGQYVDVVAHIDVGALVGHGTDDDYTCALTFTDDSSPQVVERQVRLRYLGVGDTQLFEYQGDVDPTLDGSAGPGIRFNLYEGDNHGVLEMDSTAVDGKAWRITDPGNDSKSWYRVYYDDGSGYDDMSTHGEGGNTMVARLKVHSWSNADREPWIAIEDTEASSAEYHWGGADGVASEVKRDVEENTGMGTSDYVILWLTSRGDQGDPEWQCGHEVDLYIVTEDAEILWHKHIDNASAEDNAHGGFYFGDDSGDAQMDVSFDWITGTNAGAFAPGEEVAVLGRSLILSGNPCNVPFADEDGDGDVDQTDFGAFQACYVGSGSFDWDACHCFDRDHDEDVDSDDLWAFEACATGPGVIFDAQNPPANCVPY
jgi:hypothetical protein